MIRVCYIPADPELDIELVDVETIDALTPIEQRNPYKVAKYLVERRSSGDVYWSEMVRTPYGNTALMVDEEGLLKRLPYNSRASMTHLYAGGALVGDVVVVRYVLVDDDFELADLTPHRCRMVGLTLGGS